MFCVVFWNIQGKAASSGIVRLISGLQRDHDADVVALAECSDGVVGSVLRALNPRGTMDFALAPTRSRVRVLIRRTISRAEEVDSHPYYSVLSLWRGKDAQLLFAAVHMISPLENEKSDIDTEIKLFAEAIRRAEQTAGHTRTVVAGDLNAHPFSDGVASAVGLHGVMSRAVAEQGWRQAKHRRYPFFFNPMWRFFGDGSAGPAGTYYREPGGDHTAYYWHLIDQVLIRPDLVPFYRDDSVCIVTAVGGTSLAGPNWAPDRAVGSDHYPVRIRILC